MDIANLTPMDVVRLEQFTIANNCIDDCQDAIYKLLNSHKHSISALLCEMVEAAAERQEMMTLLGVNNIDELMGISLKVQEEKGETWE